MSATEAHAARLMPVRLAATYRCTVLRTGTACAPSSGRAQCCAATATVGAGCTCMRWCWEELFAQVVIDALVGSLRNMGSESCGSGGKARSGLVTEGGGVHTIDHGLFRGSSKQMAAVHHLRSPGRECYDASSRHRGAGPASSDTRATVRTVLGSEGTLRQNGKPHAASY